MATKQVFTIITIITAACISSSITEAASNDEEAIKRLAIKTNMAYRKENGPEIFNEILSDKGFSIAIPSPQDPSTAIIVNKQSFITLFKNFMQTSRPKKHDHQVESVTVIGPLAYEIGKITSVTQNDVQYDYNVINFFAKDVSGWVMIHSTPLENIKRAINSNGINDEADIRRLAHSYVESFSLKSKGSLGFISKVLAADVISITSTGSFLQGKGNVVDAYKQSLEEVKKNFDRFDMNYDIKSIKLSPGGAIVFGKVTIDGKLKNSDQRFSREVWETLVLQRIQGKWLIIQEHSTKNAN